MADNLAVTAGTGTNVASDEVTYSGDTAKLGIVRLVHVTGAEGSKTVSELVRLEDAAHTSADPGVPVLGVRQDTAASLAGTDGDYTMPIFDASGRQHVNVGASALPTGAATSAKQDTGNTSLASIDGKITAVDTGAVVVASSALPSGAATAAKQADVYTEDAAAAANPVGGAVILVREDGRAGSLTTTDGDNVALRGNNKGEAYVKDTDAGALLTTIDADTSNLSTKIDTIAGAVAGTEMQVDVLTMPTVTVTASNLDVQSGGADLATSTQAGAIQTAAELIDDAIYVDDADWTDSTSKHALVGGLYQSTPQTVTDGDVAPFNITANGALHVSDAGGSLTVDGTVTANLSATDNTVLDNIDTSTAAAATSLAGLDNAVDGNYLNVNVNVAGTDVVSGSGTATGALRVELPTNGTGVIATVGAVTAITNALPAGTNAIGKLAANSGVDIGDVDVLTVNGVAPAFGTGTRAATVQRVTIATDDVVPASQSGTWTVQPGNTANTTPWLVTDSPATSGGLSKFHLVGAATDNATNIKASAGQVYSITAFNLSASPRYLKFHNTAGTPTAGSGVTDTFLIPGNTSGAGLVLNIDKGIAFGTGIGITIVTGIADSNTTAIGASEVVINVYYK